MTIGQLARAASVPASTIRFYERRRLLLPTERSSGNYRLYDAREVDRLRFIRRAQALGFTLADISLLLRVSAGQVLKRRELDQVATVKLHELDARIADLERVRAGLVTLLAQPCVDLGAPCPVISALVPP